MRLIDESFSGLRNLWKITGFKQNEVSNYASRQMLNETRQGVRVLSIVLLVLLLVAAIGFKWFYPEQHYAYSYGLLALLALHIHYSSLQLRDIQTLHALGMTLLVIIGVTLIFIGRQTGELDSGLAVSIVLLFMVIPLVPWGLCEALVVVALIYLVFTLSSAGALRYFSTKSLWALQYLMLGSSLICLVVVARNVVVRKNDLSNRFELEQARNKMELQSFRDALTGAWNRRYLEQHFGSLCRKLMGGGQSCCFVLVDIDHFKAVNDTLGHDLGDQVLLQVVSLLKNALSDDEVLIRMGGDEFALLMNIDQASDRVNKANQILVDTPIAALAEAGVNISLSAGLLSIDPEAQPVLNDLYRQADQLLYEAKRTGRSRLVEMQDEEVTHDDK